MATQFWYLGGGQWALYTTEPAIRDVAAGAGLKMTGTYYSSRTGEESAWQFAGDKKTVAAIAKLGGGTKRRSGG